MRRRLGSLIDRVGLEQRADWQALVTRLACCAERLMFAESPQEAAAAEATRPRSCLGSTN